MKFKFHRRDITGLEAHQIIYSAQEKYYENDRKYTLPYKKSKVRVPSSAVNLSSPSADFRASDFMGFTLEWWHSLAAYAAMPGKLWFPRNRRTNMTENAHFRIEKACRGYPLRLGTFSTFGSWRPSGFCSPYKCLHGP